MCSCWESMRMKNAATGGNIRMKTWEKIAFAASLSALAAGMATLPHFARGVGPAQRATAHTPTPALPTGVQPADRRVMNASFGRLPMRFESNVGQTDARVKFLSRGPGSTLFLTANEAVLSLRANSAASKHRAGHGAENPSARRAVVRMALVGASNNPEVVGEDALPGRQQLFHRQQFLQMARGRSRLCSSHLPRRLSRRGRGVPRQSSTV